MWASSGDSAAAGGRKKGAESKRRPCTHPSLALAQSSPSCLRLCTHPVLPTLSLHVCIGSSAEKSRDRIPESRLNEFFERIRQDDKLIRQTLENQPMELEAAKKNLGDKLYNQLILAPLTRGGNLPFRRLCADFGANVTFSEMVSVFHAHLGAAKKQGRNEANVSSTLLPFDTLQC